jgi:hypothetical protein
MEDGTNRMAPHPDETLTSERRPHSGPHGRQAVSWRAILTGVVLIPINCYWMAVMELQWNSLDSTCVSLFFHVVFLLLLLTGINALVGRRWPSRAFTQSELMVVYIMLSLASAVMGRDSLENLLPTLGHLFWFDDPASGYHRFWQYVPTWLAPRDHAALKAYYIGGESLYTWRNLRPWLAPATFWILFVLVLTWIMLCINIVLRKQWTENEKLTFPIIQIPLAITNPSTYSSRVFWIGVAIPVAIQTMNNLNYFYPWVPSIWLKLQDVSAYLPNPPWNSLGWTPVAFFPFAIGFAFFLPLDLSFSCWFFYLLRKAEELGCAMWGFRDPGAAAGFGAAPFTHEQGAGAWIGLSIALLWMARHHLRSVVKLAIRPSSPTPASENGRGGDDGMSYRSALLGLLGGMITLTGLCVAAGMSIWLPVVYFLFYFILSVGITRVRAELGPPAHELNWVNPERFMVSIFGTQALGAQNLTLLSFMFWFNRGYRCHPMPHQLEAFKIGQETRMESRRLLWAIVIAVVVGTVASMWALLDMYYRNGETSPKIMSYSTGIGREAFGRLRDWQDNPRRPDGVGLTFSALGALITLALAFAKSRFFWWPFHPIGYALANSYALEYFWTCIFIGWFIKFWIVRYGGVRGYRRAIPFFMGLIIGDYVIAAVWSLAGWILGVSTYRTFIF